MEVVAQLTANLGRGGKDCFLEHVLKLSPAVFVRVRDPPREGFVTTMLAPRLRDGLQFRIGRFTAKLAKMGLDRLHFDQGEVQLARTAQLHQPLVVKFPKWDGGQAKLVRLAHFQAIQLQRTDHDLFNRIVGQYLAA